MSGRLAYVATRFREVTAYRADLLVWLINPVLQLILLATIWRAVYAGRTSMDGVALPAMTTYVSIAALHTLINRDDVVRWVETRVRTGVIAMDLLRPISILEQVLWGQVSQLLMKLGMIAIMLPLAALVSGISAPVAVGPYALATVLGWLVNCCIHLLLSAIAFWTMELGGITFLFYVVSNFMAGGLVPLWFMPSWLADTLAWLPLQATLYTPVSIYLGQAAGTAAWQAIGVQALWVVILGGGAVAVWKRAVHRVVVQGG